MELFGRVDGLALVDSAVLGETGQIGVVEDAWYDALADYSMASVVYNCCCQVAQSFDFKSLQRTEAGHVVVGLAPAWIILERRQILESVHLVDCKAEEYIIVYENL